MVSKTASQLKSKQGQPINTLVITEQEEPKYHLGALHDIAAGNNDFILTLVKIFLDTIPANSNEMVKACSEGNWDLVSKLAHKLKSTVDMMRIKSITQEIRTIELDGKRHVNKESLPALVKKVDETIMEVSAQLREEFDL